MAKFFETKSGSHVNAERVCRVRVKAADDDYNEKPFFVQFVFESYSDGSGHDTKEEAEAELAAFLEFANQPFFEVVGYCPVDDQVRVPTEQPGS